MLVTANSSSPMSVWASSAKCFLVETYAECECHWLRQYFSAAEFESIHKVGRADDAAQLVPSVMAPKRLL